MSVVLIGNGRERRAQQQVDLRANSEAVSKCLRPAPTGSGRNGQVAPPAIALVGGNVGLCLFLQSRFFVG